MKPVIRCSGLDRLITCPASRTLEGKLHGDIIDLSGQLRGDEMTWRGNWCHWESARVLIEQHGAIGSVNSRPEIPPGWHPRPWDERTAKWYVSSVLMDLPPGYTLFVETPFFAEFDRFLLQGHIDTHAISEDQTEFVIEDQKTGPSEVDVAEDNWQVAGYGVLLKKNLPKLMRGVMRIRQRAAIPPTSEVEVDNLAMLSVYVEAKINEALIKWRELNVAYKACRLCDCILFCPALEEEIIEMKKLLSDVDLKTIDVNPSLKQLAELAARGRAVAGPITRILDAVRERVALEGPVVLKDGSTVSIIDAEGKREVTNPKVAFDLMREEFENAHKPEGVWKAVDISLTNLEDALVEDLDMQRKSIVPDKPTAQQWIKRNLGPIIERKPIKKLVFK